MAVSLAAAVFAALVGVRGPAPTSLADPPREEEFREIRQMVRTHIEAWREQDAIGASRWVAAEHADKGLTPVAFCARLWDAHAPIDPNARVSFGRVGVLPDGTVAVETIFLDPSGGASPRFFRLVRERNGWRIRGIQRSRRWIDGTRMIGKEA